jgi:hypothetical protein
LSHTFLNVNNQSCSLCSCLSLSFSWENFLPKAMAVVPQPPYFFLFPWLKLKLKGRHFNNWGDWVRIAGSAGHPPEQDFQDGKRAGNNADACKETTMRVMVASRPTVFDQMPAPVPKIIDSSSYVILNIHVAVVQHDEQESNWFRIGWDEHRCTLATYQTVIEYYTEVLFFTCNHLVWTAISLFQRLCLSDFICYLKIHGMCILCARNSHLVSKR